MNQPLQGNNRNQAVYSFQSIKKKYSLNNTINSSALMLEPLLSSSNNLLAFDKPTHVSQYKNFPSYSFTQGSIPYKQVISKDHVQDIQGKESPGVGAYSVAPAYFK